MRHRPPQARVDGEARGYRSLKHLHGSRIDHLRAVRQAADQRKIAQADRPRFAMLRRIVRAIRGGGD